MVFVTILVIFSISLLIVSKSSTPENQASIQVEQQQTQEMKAAELARAAAEKETKVETERKEAESKITRTIPEFAKAVIVKMPPTKDGFDYCNLGSGCTHHINIPTLGIIVYEKDSEKTFNTYKKTET